jgi:hypothetical protein
MLRHHPLTLQSAFTVRKGHRAFAAPFILTGAIAGNCGLVLVFYHSKLVCIFKVHGRSYHHFYQPPLAFCGPVIAFWQR